MARAVWALRERLGDEAMSEFQGLLDDTGQKWREDLRIDMAKEFATMRVEMAREFAAVRVEVLKWSFLFWIGQFAAVSGMMAFLLRTIR